MNGLSNAGDAGRGCKRRWNAQMLVMQGMPRMLAKFARVQRMLAEMLATVRGECTVFAVFFDGRATWHQKPVARPGRPGMFWGPSVWAGLRAGDAGNAEEDLGVQQNPSAVYPTGRVALALRARRHTAQQDYLVLCYVIWYY